MSFVWLVRQTPRAMAVQMVFAFFGKNSTVTRNPSLRKYRIRLSDRKNTRFQKVGFPAKLSWGCSSELETNVKCRAETRQDHGRMRRKNHFLLRVRIYGRQAPMESKSENTRRETEGSRCERVTQRGHPWSALANPGCPTPRDRSSRVSGCYRWILVWRRASSAASS